MQHKPDLFKAALTAVQEALDDGDIAYAKAIVTSALSDNPDRVHACSCGVRFRWPGELEAHLMLHDDHWAVA